MLSFERFGSESSFDNALKIAFEHHGFVPKSGFDVGL
jgi:hypothetical protein